MDTSGEATGYTEDARGVLRYWVVIGIRRRVTAKTPPIEH
ncbi:Hypothetical protein A7982_01800 [Minicystis rosea]|nr:Hypothetical protein A7982_01800 [Minicystis rosea]